ADGMVNDARSRAQTMISTAHVKAEDLERQSQDKAAALERDAARKHAEIIGSISQQKTVLEKKVDELRTFENEYRNRVKTYLESQLRELELRAFTAPAETPRPQQDLTPVVGRPAEAAGAHRADPQYGSGVADVARIPAPRNGSFNGEPTAEAGAIGMRWEPAV
ncbi:MAG: hypothetical protein LC721_09775, partial [Actinobacteria bacterium]|nr:hypothetical protein [Actinomycetota bacterium]